MRPVEIELWSDVVCPWCWIGKARLERALDRVGLRDEARIRMRAFQLDPARPRLPLLDYLDERFGTPRAQTLQHVARVVGLGAELGLELDYGKAIAAPTLDAHRLVQLAAADGLDPELMERLHRAHFAEGVDVADGETLARLATEVGLDPDAVARVLSTEELADAVESDQRAAYALGVQGVPFFVFGRRLGVSGAQPLELFEQALTRARAAA
jgi:predicted DsbA family dithiol-disulfide isomerase